MCFFGFEGAADEIKVNREWVHFDEAFWTEKYMFDCEYF